MDHYTHRRRHGLYERELETVHKAIRHVLWHLVEERSNLHDAKILFQVIFRMDHHHGEHHMGRCKYPANINMKLIEEYLRGQFVLEKDLIKGIEEEEQEMREILLDNKCPK